MNLIINAVQKYGYKPQVMPQKQPVTIPKPIQQDTFQKSNVNNKPTEVSILYLNDFHGQNIRMERVASAIKQFDNCNLYSDFFSPKQKVDKMKFASGDMFLGENMKNLKVVNEFFNISGILANVLANHECDKPTEEFVKILENKKYHLLGANLHPTEGNPIHKVLAKSYIQEINGDKYGIIGLVPTDLPVHVKIKDHLPDLKIDDMDATLKDLQKEVQDLETQDVNKIIVLSHVGYKNDKKIAQTVKGVDVILGAHTHNLIEGIKEGENLYYSKDGSPIIITQAGRDGEHFGVLNLKFNEKGQITAAQNNLAKTEDFHRDFYARKCFEEILGKPEKVGRINSIDPTPKDIYINENPNCNFMLDALKSELNTDIALMNAANIRGKFDTGSIDTRALQLLSPFANHIAVIEASEKEIVDAIKRRVKVTMQSSSHRPGILQVSGLKYSFNKQGEVLNISFIDKNGKENPLNINNPRTDKTYTVASDDFCIASQEMGLGLSHRYDTALKKFEEDKDKFVADYIRHLNKPVDIKSDGRIKIVD